LTITQHQLSYEGRCSQFWLVLSDVRFGSTAVILPQIGRLAAMSTIGAVREQQGENWFLNGCALEKRPFNRASEELQHSAMSGRWRVWGKNSRSSTQVQIVGALCELYADRDWAISAGCL